MMNDAWIQTYTGRAFTPLTPRAEDICIEDIAHALSMQCRFVGHCRLFYSTAQHCVMVSENVPPVDAMWGLLHDAGEACLGDMARPTKQQMPEYRSIERGIMLAVAEAFGLQFPEPESVKIADMRLLATERRDLMNGSPGPWPCLEGVEPLKQIIVPDSPEEAEQAFLCRFDFLLCRMELAA